MLRTLLTSGALIIALAQTDRAAAQQEDSLNLKLQRNLITAERGDEPSPVFIEADRIRGYSEREAEAEGHVRMRRRGVSLSADEMRYDVAHDELTASGNIRLENQGNVVEGIRLKYNLSTDRGYLDRATFDLVPAAPKPVPAQPTPGDPMRVIQRLSGSYSRGNAERLLFEGPQRFRAEQANYTTCGPANEDWFIRAREIEFDNVKDEAIARGARVEFLDKTIFYTPYISFPLHQQRKSGILTPHYGTSNTSGIEVTVPYYWNIAPNYDATFYPREMTKRGLQLGAEFRYLEPTFLGEARGEYLPGDRVAHRDRYGYALRHSQGFSNGWSGGFNINRVSDDRYFSDLSSNVALTSTTTLPMEFTLGRGGTFGNAGTYGFSALAQKWQTLQTDPLAPITPPYDRLPQLTFTAFKQDLYRTDVDLLTSYVDFHHPTLVNGRRLLAYPSVTLPLQTPSAYLIPKVGVHATQYFINPNSQGFVDQTRVLPIFTTETGVVFEREMKFAGLPLIQTLEPKLFYVNIPYRNQDRIPNFESGIQDVSFATIFTENQFSGHDRINDANQLTVGAISRLIRQEDGVERLRVALAQRYYFEPQRVTVPDVPARPDHRFSSDLLAAISGTIYPNWTVEAGWQHNTDIGATQKFNVATRYQPDYGKVINLAYRNTRDLINQTDVSFQWPVGNNWSVIGRWNWSIEDKRTLEGLAGFEYDGGCWAFRMVGHRFATSLSNVNQSVFMQLELNGVSRIGSNPLDVLRRNVGGYTRIDPRATRLEDNYYRDR
jgi:LPS-assembly protein